MQSCGLIIEKCSSPTGDGNFDELLFCHSVKIIEKCSSPTGDGNLLTDLTVNRSFELRNVVPRQGTETVLFLLFFNLFPFIEKCSSPTGD